jgi:hypothetical protein
MAEPLTRQAVVWGAPFLAVILGAELVVIGIVGVFAATPPAASTYLPDAASQTNPSGGGGAIVSFTSPDPLVGAPSLVLNLIGPVFCAIHTPLPTPPPCPYATVVNCLDSACQHPGGFFANLSLRLSNATVFVPDHESIFLVTYSAPGDSALVVTLDWFDSWGIPTAVTSLGAFFTAILVGGLVLAPLAWPSWKRFRRTTGPLALRFW